MGSHWRQLKRRSNTKRPHEPHALYLDEGISGPTLASILRRGGLRVLEYQTLCEKNKKIPDDSVIGKVCESGFILVTKDEAMQSDWIEEIIEHKARALVLTDGHGNVVHWAAALISSEAVWERALLDHLIGPLIIRINRQGVHRVDPEPELVALCQRLKTSRIVRAKRSVVLYARDGTNDKTKA
jgi:hypothetical protein